MTYTPVTISSFILTGKVKSSDTSRTNTSTVADDPDLSVSLKANTRYVVTADLIYTSTLIGGFKVKFNLPTGATIQFAHVGQQDGLVKNVADLLGITVTTTNPNYMFLRGIIKTGSTSGNVTIRWSQNVASSLGSAVLKADSSLLTTELT